MENAPLPATSKLSLLLHFPQLLGQGWRFFRENGVGASLAAINSRDAHPFIQFIKYAICGVGALLLHTIIFKILIMKVWPELENTNTDPWTRAKATLSPTIIGLLCANVLVYWLNTKWVFTQGRHHPVKEFLLFTLVNLPGAIGGFLGQSALIAFLNWPPLAAILGFVIPNVLINYICRKFFIFKK